MESEVSIAPENKKAIWLQKLNIVKKKSTKDKFLFVFMLSTYLIMMLFALREPELLETDKESAIITFYFGLLMALFSFWIAFCYSDIVSHKLLSIISTILDKIGIKIRKVDEKYYLFLFVIIFMIASFFLLIYIEHCEDIRYISKGNIQNIITWFSLLIFAIDKALSES